MARYLNLDDVEYDLNLVSSRLDEYRNDESFHSGYDTAVDVATCINENSVWHFSELPENEVRVLVFRSEINMIDIGYCYDGVWYDPEGGTYDPGDVAAWMQMPDLPDVYIVQE